MNLMIVKIDEIKHESGYRGTEEQLQELVGSILDYGVLDPILIDSDYNLLEFCGRRRLEACKRIGLSHIPAYMTREVSHLLRARYNRKHSLCQLKLAPLTIKRFADQIRAELREERAARKAEAKAARKHRKRSKPKEIPLT